MKNFKLITLLVFFVAGLTVGCSKDDDKNTGDIELSVSESKLTVSSAGGEMEFDITCNGKWTINCNEDWISFDTESGKKDATVTVTAEKNTASETRKATVTITAGDITKKITVTQTAANDPNDGGGKVPLVKEIYYNGELSYTFEYDNNNRISIMYDVDWDATWTFTYNGSGKITSINVNGDVAPMEYKGNTSIILDWWGDELTLNSDGFVTKIVGDDYTQNLTYTNGNQTKNVYKEGNETYTHSFTYDTKKAPFYNCKTPKWFLQYRDWWWDSFFDTNNNKNSVKWPDNTTNILNLTYTSDGYLKTREMNGNIIEYIYTK